jgi:hypothetical protein
MGAFRGLGAESPVFLPGLAGKKTRPRQGCCVLDDEALWAYTCF